MSTTSILNALTQSRLITQTDEASLRGAATSTSFLGKLVQIFQNKVQLYLRACHPLVKKVLEAEGVESTRISAAVVQKTMECALNVFLESDPSHFLPSLRLLLARSEPGLLDSLGLKTITESGDSIQELVQKVFIAYIARYRLFCTVDENALSAICQEVDEAEAPQLFPPYLLDSFRLGRQLSIEIQPSLLGKSQAETAQLLATQVETNAETVGAAVRATVFFLGKTIDRSALPQTVQDAVFNHLSSSQSSLEFAGAIATGYVEEMQQPQKQLEVRQDVASALNTKICQACLPALKLLGVPVVIDHTALDRRIQEIRTRLEENERNRASIDSRIATARDEANRRINAWRASIPERPITFGIQVGIPLN